MFRLLLPIALVLYWTLPAFAQQQGQSSTLCRTPLGIPCSTIRYQESQFFFGGLGDVEYNRSWSVRAVRSDGSFVTQRDTQSLSLRGYRLLRDSSFMYLSPQDELIRVNHGQQTVSGRSPRIWHDRPYRRSKDGDKFCSSGILHNGTDFKLEGESTVAGVPVMKWTRGDKWNGDEIYLAPSLDCAALKSYTVRRRGWFLPRIVSSSEAISVEFGEPKPELFTVPSEYKRLEDPHQNRLLQFVQRSP